MERLLIAIAQKDWFINALGVIILAAMVLALILIAMHMVGKHLHDFFSFMKAEAKDFGRLNPSAGAINFSLIVFLILFGAFAIVATEAHKLVGFLAAYVGVTKAEIFAKSVDFNTLVYVVAAVGVISVLAVAKGPAR